MYSSTLGLDFVYSPYQTKETQAQQKNKKKQFLSDVGLPGRQEDTRIDSDAGKHSIKTKQTDRTSGHLDVRSLKNI